MAQLGVRRRLTPTAGRVPPAVPDKLYFRIGEVANLCGLPAYVLRFWESEFPQLRPNKGGTGQRLYRRRDVFVVLRIKTLLYEGGYTIPGARQVLSTEQRKEQPQLSLAIVENGIESESESSQRIDRKALRQLRTELREVLKMLGGAEPSEAILSIRTVRSPRSRIVEATRVPDLFDSTGTGRTDDDR